MDLRGWCDLKVEDCGDCREYIYLQLRLSLLQRKFISDARYFEQVQIAGTDRRRIRDMTCPMN